MAEVDSAAASKDSALPASPTANGDAGDKTSKPEPEVKLAKTLEQRYIELLEEKIARLEAEIKLGKKDDEDEKKDGKDLGDSNGTDKDEKSKANGSKDGEGDEKKKKSDKSTRVRYIKRSFDGDSMFSDFKDEEVPGFGGEDKPEDTKQDDYAVAWRQTPSTTIGGKSKRELLIESKALRKALKEVLQDYPGTSFDTAEVAIAAPYAIIYHNTEKLREYGEKHDDVTKADIAILLEEIEQVQATERNDALNLAKDGKITYDLLWTLFYPGCKVCQKSFVQEEHVLIVSPFINQGPKEDEFALTLWGLDHDGENFKYLESKVSIASFKGTKEIIDLDVYPLDKWRSRDGSETLDELKEKLIIRGQKFEQMCNAKTEDRFRRYGGPVMKEGEIEMLGEGGGGDFDGEGDDNMSDSPSSVSLTKKLQARTLDGMDKLEDNSFVMVDHKAYLTFGRKAIRLGDEDVTHMPCSCTSCLGLRKKCIGELERGDSSKKKKPQKLTRDMHLLCPPRVFGFALRQKVWVQMLVDNVKEMDQKDKETAYKKLELDSKSKNILKTLVLQHSNETNKIDDLIPGKGNGLIVLLHGPPGVGKTLTAESLALLSGKPLYSVSMSDVGTSPTVVEKNLIRVFELATHWKALLLFDEADVFLGTRTLDNLRRNSLVSVLIRILEYFEGILFLTSNRVKTFDEAFQSRIHVAVRYKELTEPSRVKIWRIWINKAGDNIDDLAEIEEQLESGGELAGAELNGRQIRNVFRSALALATARGVGSKLTYKDIRAVLSSTVEFQNYMVQNKELAEKAGIR